MPVYAVEIPLRPDELSDHMVAMRTWLDRERVEPSNFSCRESECGMLIRIEFRIAREAEEFAERFSQATIGY
jgi:hypothetical protein